MHDLPLSKPSQRSYHLSLPYFTCSCMSRSLLCSAINIWGNESSDKCAWYLSSIHRLYFSFCLAAKRTLNYSKFCYHWRRPNQKAAAFFNIRINMANINTLYDVAIFYSNNFTTFGIPAFTGNRSAALATGNRNAWQDICHFSHYYDTT